MIRCLCVWVCVCVSPCAAGRRLECGSLVRSLVLFCSGAAPSALSIVIFISHSDRSQGLRLHPACIGCYLFGRCMCGVYMAPTPCLCGVHVVGAGCKGMERRADTISKCTFFYLTVVGRHGAVVGDSPLSRLQRAYESRSCVNDAIHYGCD